MAEMADQEELIRLLGAVAHHDRIAFKRLYDRVSGRLFGLCHKVSGQRELAEEALQDAFVRIWHSAGDYHAERGTPLSWMMTIARNRTLDLLRSRQSRATVSDDNAPLVEDERGGPLDATLRRDSAEVLSGCLEELSAVQRDSILLSYYRGLTHDQLADVLSTPVGTVKSWIRRGLKSLKRCLEQ